MSERTNSEQAGTSDTAKAIARPERCPECGNPGDQPGAVVPRSLFHWRTTVPAIAVIVAMSITAALVWRERETLRVGSGTPFAFALEPAITFEDIIAHANGESRSPSLVETIRAEAGKRVTQRSYVPGDSTVAVSFVDREGKQRGLRRNTLTIGWPSNWWNQIEYTLYEDVFTKSGFVPMSTVTSQSRTNVIFTEGELVASNAGLDDSGLVWPRKRWSWGGYGAGNLAFRPPPEETGGRTLWIDVNFFNIASVLGLIAMAWIVPSILIWFANVVRGSQRSRWRGRLFKFVCLVLTIGVVAWMTNSSVARSDFFAPSYRSPQRPSMGGNDLHDTTIRVSHLAGLWRAEDGDRQVAQAIINAVQPAPHADQRLAVSFQHDAVIESGSTTYVCRMWPLFTTGETTFVERVSQTTPKRVANPAGYQWNWTSSYLTVRRSQGDPNIPEKSWTVNVGTLGATLFGFFVIWFAAVLICRVIAAAIVRRRRRSSRCLACGHALGPAPLNA